MDMKYGNHDAPELLGIMRARIAEQPDMFITTLENYESLKNSQLNYTSNNTYDSRNNIKLVSSQTFEVTLSQESLSSIQKSQKKVVCSRCDASFSILQYESHKQSCQLQCKLCSKKFFTINSLKKHTCITHKLYKLDEFQCNLCSSETFSTKLDLKKHFKEIHSNDSLYKCPSCTRLIGTLSLFKKHIQKHLNIKKCRICDAQYICKRAFKIHFQRHKLKNPNLCLENEIIKTNEPVINDYSQCVVDLEKESDSDNEENTEDGNKANDLSLPVSSQNNTNCIK